MAFKACPPLRQRGLASPLISIESAQHHPSLSPLDAVRHPRGPPLRRCRRRRRRRVPLPMAYGRTCQAAGLIDETRAFEKVRSKRTHKHTNTQTNKLASERASNSALR
jgi:hypothetical protein